MEDNIKARRVKCTCGKTRMVSVIDPDGAPFDKETKKEHAKLVNAGCDIDTISLQEAREVEMCFTCKL